MWGLLCSLFLISCSEKEIVIDRGLPQIWALVDSATWEASSVRQTWKDWQSLGQQKGWAIRRITSEDMIKEDSLAPVSMLLLWGVDVSRMAIQPQADIERYVQSGGGLVAIDCPYLQPWSWPWWEKIVAEKSLVL